MKSVYGARRYSLQEAISIRGGSPPKRVHLPLEIPIEPQMATHGLRSFFFYVLPASQRVEVEMIFLGEGCRRVWKEDVCENQLSLQ